MGGIRDVIRCYPKGCHRPNFFRFMDDYSNDIVNEVFGMTGRSLNGFDFLRGYNVTQKIKIQTPAILLNMQVEDGKANHVVFKYKITYLDKPKVSDNCDECVSGTPLEIMERGIFQLNGIVKTISCLNIYQKPDGCMPCEYVLEGQQSDGYELIAEQPFKGLSFYGYKFERNIQGLYGVSVYFNKSIYIGCDVLDLNCTDCD